jgi:thioesterase domain-containing protein
MRVYLFRGLAGAVFSTGMDRLAEKLAHAGHTATVHAWIERTAIEAEALAQLARGEIAGPIAVVGHSLGGNSANFMGRNLAKSGAPIAYVATVDPTEPEPSPGGIACDNFRSRDFRAEKVEGATDHFRPDLNHVEIDKDERVHQRILAMCAATPAMPSGPAPNQKGVANIETLLGEIISGKGANLETSDLEALLAALSGADQPPVSQPVADPANLPVNFALGKTIGNALNGRKTGLGVIGLLATTVLPVLFPQLAPIKAILASIGLEGAAATASPGQSILMPLFGALATWGGLGKFEKWAKLLTVKS